jgi:hypothetical protein
MWIDVGKLIREHIPDKNGSVLPADLSSGTYEFRDLLDYTIGSLFEGKVIYDKTYGHVTYGCAGCCAYYPGPWLTFNPIGIPFGGGSQNGVWATQSCTDNDVDVSTAFRTWRTANTSIATVDMYGWHTGVNVGSTTSTASGSLSTTHPTSCPIDPYSPGGSDNVGPPDHLKVVSDTYQASSACPTTSRRLIKYQEVDFNNNPVGTIQSKEQFASKSSNTCNNGNPGTSETCSTDTNGTFTDQLWIGCNSVGGSCGVTYTKQQWLWCPSGGATPVVLATPGDCIVHNDSISVGGNTAGFSAGTCIYSSGSISATCVHP